AGAVRVVFGVSVRRFPLSRSQLLHPSSALGRLDSGADEWKPQGPGESLREKRLSACAIAGILTDQDARRSRVLASPILGAQFSGEGALRSGAQVPTYVHCACGAPSPGARSVGTSVPWGLRSGARESLAAGYQGSGG